MSFASLIFIYFFLPIVLVGYYVLPKSFRNLFLLIANIIFYGWGEPRFLPIILLTAIINWWIARKIEKSHTKRRFWFVFALVFDFGLLALFKYADFFLKSFGIPFQFGFSLPLGISFYTFQVVSYLIDVWRFDILPEKNLFRFTAYLTFFPQLIAGPIVRYETLGEQLSNRKENTTQIVQGIQLFLVGLAKKILLANQMGILWESMRENIQNNGILGAWLGMLAFSFQVYFDFSGYSDMAKGLGLLFGFQIPENFHYPYAAKSITEFWRRWHITLSTWFRDYIYIPLGGSHKGYKRTICNLLIVWLFTGLWHGAAWNFVLWGLYYFILLWIEKSLGEERLKKIPLVLRHAVTLLCINFGWVLFALEDFSELKIYIHSMFCGSWASTKTIVFFISYIPLILICGIASLPIGANIWRKKSNFTARLLGSILLLLLCTAALVANSYNPFLYFRF